MHRGKSTSRSLFGSPDLSGFHPLLTAFQAVNIVDTVTVRPAEQMSVHCQADFDVSGVPLGESNIAWKAHTALAHHCGSGGTTRIDITKNIPVAGGMAGGSANAAATLLALNELWQAGCSAEGLYELSRQLGSDVPFSLIGGAAIGRGRGDVLQPVGTETPLHFVLVTTGMELSTPLVYRTLDHLRGDTKVSVPDQLAEDFLRAWKTGDAPALAPLMHNDLEEAAIAIEPSVATILDHVAEAGALRAMVSGSGPTVIGLARDENHAREIVARLGDHNLSAVVTQSTSQGTRLLTSLLPPER